MLASFSPRQVQGHSHPKLPGSLDPIDAKKNALARMYNNPLYLYVAVGGKTMGKNYKSTVGGRILANQFI